MILNAYAVLDAFVSLLRLGLAAFVVSGVLLVWRGWGRAADDPEGRSTLEDRCHLLYLLGGALLALNVLAWPLFYLLLQSYVKEWPGVMCVYGVTRIGSGSLGSGRFLPPLLTALQAAKPLLVFLSGAWFTLYLIDRRTRTAPLTGRVLLVLLVAGLLALGDATAEVAYLVIPKKEVLASGGCCVDLFDAEGGHYRFAPKARLPDDAGAWPWAVYCVANGGMVLALAACVRVCRRGFPAGWLTPLFVGAVVSLAVDAFFLVEVAAPLLLHLPHHHCPYDLIPRAPESLLAVTCGVGGSLAVGWGCVAGWLADDPEAAPFLPGVIGTLFRFGAIGYGTSALLLSLELALV